MINKKVESLSIADEKSKNHNNVKVIRNRLNNDIFLILINFFLVQSDKSLQCI